MGTWIGLALIGALLLWLLGVGKKRPPAPEDDVTTPIDREELDEAEREVRNAEGSGDPEAGDDWGPGTGK